MIKKRTITTLLALFLIGGVTMTFIALKPKATCSPTGSCSACKNCKYCKNCAKNKGTCSVCKKV